MHMPVLQMPALRMQILTKVNERGSAQEMARSGYIDVVGGQSNPVLLNVSAISVHPTMCTSPMTLEQLMLSQEGVSMFEFPATTYEIKAQEHLGLAVTMYINRSKDSVQHSVASIAYVNFDQIMSGAGLMLLKQHVFVDLCASSHEDSVVSKLICLTKSAQKLKDATVRKDVCEELQSVMSACLNSTLLDSAYTPLPCNGMSTHDKIEHIRSSLTLIL